MKKKIPRVTIGLVTYNVAKYINYCLPTLINQDFTNFEIIIFDNASTDDSVVIIKEKYPQIKVIESNENLGFGKAHNRMISNSKAEYYFCATIDVLYEPDFITKLLCFLDRNMDCGSVTGKLYHWDFVNQKKTKIIDTLGLKMTRGQRCFDLNQGVLEKKEFIKEREIFGCSGAAVIYRRLALNDIIFNKQYFDEAMFMYKEDVDLAYRLRWAGYKAYLIPRAIAYHDRTASKTSLKDRKKSKSLFVRQQSLLNQLILEQKNFSKYFTWKTKWAFIWNKVLRRVYILFFERELWGGYRKMEESRGRIENEKLRAKEIEKFFI